MKFKARREIKKTRIEIIPMIDTMFFLLVFFMLSSLSLTHLNGVKVDLPKTASLPAELPSKLTLTITHNQELLLNDQSIRKESLQSEIQKITTQQKLNLETTTFIINADNRVSHGFVVGCIDDSRAAGITHFAIATTPKSS